MTVRDVTKYSLPFLARSSAYIDLGDYAQGFIKIIVSILASVAIGKIRMPEFEEPVTPSHVVVGRGESDMPRIASPTTHLRSNSRVELRVILGERKDSAQRPSNTDNQLALKFSQLYLEKKNYSEKVR